MAVCLKSLIGKLSELLRRNEPASFNRGNRRSTVGRGLRQLLLRHASDAPQPLDLRSEERGRARARVRVHVPCLPSLTDDQGFLADISQPYPWLLCPFSVVLQRSQPS